MKHFLQSKSWADVRAAQGHKPVWIDDALLLVKKLPIGSMGYMPQVTLKDLNWEKLSDAARSMHLTHVQLDPADLAAAYTIPIAVLENYNLKPTESIFYRYTRRIDITRSEEELLAQMHHKWRYNIKLALKRGVKVRITDDDRDLETFLKLFFETVERQKYFGRDPEYYRTIWKILKPQGKVKIATASFEGKDLVTWMLFVDDGVIYYPYGGSSTEHRDVMPTYALVWEITQWGKQNGYHTFDLWGTLGPNADEKDKEFGFHRFKSGFGGEEIEYAPSYDLVINPMLYNLFKVGNSLRWFLLKLKKLIR
jgi:lipid II:glycine glycyltransferase (peptidoglycan interpeptide bridge formation enzyme)